jgi:hypothetical protein
LIVRLAVRVKCMVKQSKDTHRHTDTQTHTDTKKHRHTDTKKHRHTDTQTHRHTQTYTHTDTQIHKHIHKGEPKIRHLKRASGIQIRKACTMLSGSSPKK